MGADRVVLGVEGLQELLDALIARGFTVVGPTVRDGAVVHAPLSSVAELPAGRRDEQEAGHYRLRETDDPRLFAFAAAAQSWKPWFFPPRQPLMTITAEGEVAPHQAPAERYALLGVRSCDLAALAVHDRALTTRGVVDGAYEARRRECFVVAITCSHPGGTCFCVSMGTGPVPEAGFDLAMTELLDEHGHRFVLHAGSDQGAAVLDELPARPARADDLTGEALVGEAACGAMGRAVDAEGLRDVLFAAADHSRWQEAGSRCLSCTNCTLVCPTCFCVTTDDRTALDGSTDRGRVWDSCFTAGHSYLHGGPVRATTDQRYRQWLTHKFGSWVDQFGTSGCVGCGRCITWCPAGIDVTEELAALREPGGES